MSKNIYLFISLFMCILGVKAARISRPHLQQPGSLQFSPGQKFKLKGKGFIQNRPRVHKVILKNGQSKYKIDVLGVLSNGLELRIPDELAYGDYDLKLRLKSRFFQSRVAKLRDSLELRPNAPNLNDLGLVLLTKGSDLLDLQDMLDANLGEQYRYSLNEIEPGLNDVSASYIDQGFESQRSKVASFHYVPEEYLSKINYQDQNASLQLSSEEVDYARNKINQELDAINLDFEFIEDTTQTSFSAGKQFSSSLILDLTPLLQKESLELNEKLLLRGISGSEIVLRETKLSPIKITKIHATNPESLRLMNLSSRDLDINGCKLYDALKAQYEFAEVINAKSEIEIQESLSLNDSGDEVALYCPDYLEISGLSPYEEYRDGLKLINKIQYTSIDSDGFAVF